MNVKKKVIYVIHDLSMGGVEVALLSAVGNLNNHFNTCIICLGKIDTNLVENLTKEERSTFVSFPFDKFFYPFGLLKVIKHILVFDPDILICSLWRASMVGTAIKMLRPKTFFVSFIHSTTFFHYLDKFFSQKAIKYADEVLTDSNATSNFIISELSPSCPVNTVSFLTNVSPSQKKNLPLIKGNEINFIFLGRIHEVKNIPLAIDVIEYLHSIGINAILDLYGRKNKLLNSILLYASQKKLSDRIHFKGELDASNKSIIFGKYNFLIQLSSIEGMAMSVAEAMQHGLVCIVTPVGEIPNYSKDMESAIFFDIVDKTLWSDSLKKITSVIQDVNLYNTISDNCFNSFQDIETYSESLIKYINNRLTDL